MGWNTPLLLSALVAICLPVVLADPHGRQLNARRHVRRRLPDARDIECDSNDTVDASYTAASSSASASVSANVSAIGSTAFSPQASCTTGDFQCNGMELQECANGSWQTLATCSGDNIVCSVEPGVVGCVWNWDVTSSGGPAPIASPSSASLSSLTTNATPSGFAAAPSSYVAGSATAPSASGTDDDWEDEEDCEDEEDENVSASASASASMSMSATLPSTSSPSSASATAGGLAQQMAAGSSSSAAASSSSSQASSGSYTATLTGVATMTWSSRVSFSASQTATADEDEDCTEEWTSSGWSAGASQSARSTASAAAPSSSLSNSTLSSGMQTFSAPHWVIYADNPLKTMPSATDLKEFNRFLLSFWTSNRGPLDDAQVWANFTAAYRAKVLEEYHAAGIALMVSAFGDSEDTPTTAKRDPVMTAQKLATFVKEYSFDGVDIDYEDFAAMNGDTAEAWLISFQTELRKQLPSPYLISHAPVAPWFTSRNMYKNGAYVAVDAKVGSGIDFYNVQFYNQGNGVYGTCETLLFQSGGQWPSTSVFEINSYTGMPLEKIVIGKPLQSGDANNGYMNATTLHQCVVQAEAKGWNGGVMYWEWAAPAPSAMATVRGDS